MTVISDFFAQLRRDLEEPIEVIWPNTSLLFWANEAKNTIARITKSSEDEIYGVVSANESSYPLPKTESSLGSTLEVKAVFYNGLPLERKQVHQFAEMEDYEEDSGTPLYYTVDDEDIALFPPPSQVSIDDTGGEIRIFRYTIPPNMEAVTSSNPMPFDSLHNEAISYYVRAKAFEQIEKWDSSQAFMELWRESVSILQDQAMNESEDNTVIEPRIVW